MELPILCLMVIALMAARSARYRRKALPAPAAPALPDPADRVAEELEKVGFVALSDATSGPERARHGIFSWRSHERCKGCGGPGYRLSHWHHVTKEFGAVCVSCRGLRTIEEENIPHALREAWKSSRSFDDFLANLLREEPEPAQAAPVETDPHAYSFYHLCGLAGVLVAQRELLDGPSRGWLYRIKGENAAVTAYGVPPRLIGKLLAVSVPDLCTKCGTEQHDLKEVVRMDGVGGSLADVARICGACGRIQRCERHPDAFHDDLLEGATDIRHYFGQLAERRKTKAKTPRREPGDIMAELRAIERRRHELLTELRRSGTTMQPDGTLAPYRDALPSEDGANRGAPDTSDPKTTP